MSYDVRRYEDALRQAESKTPYRAPIEVTDKQVNNTDTSLNLVGEMFEAYSQFIFENYVWILENFSGEEPPRNAVRGQLWYRTFAEGGDGTMFIYNYPSREDIEAGVPLGDNGDSSNIDNWLDLTATIGANIESHIEDTDNPHFVTADQIGLSEVPTGMGGVLDVNFNLGDVPNKALARDNLEIYSKTEVYTRTELDNLLLSDNPPGTAYDADTLNGEHHDVFMKKAAPVATDTFSIDPVSTPTGLGNIMQADNRRTLLWRDDDNVNDNFAFAFGAEENDVISGTASLVGWDNDETDPKWNIIFFDQAAAITSYTQLRDDNLYIFNGAVYHQGHPPTSAEIGALPLSGTADNSFLLNGAAPDHNPTPDTIAYRDALYGTILGTGVVSTRTTENSMGTNAEVIVKSDTVNDDFWRYASKSEILEFLGSDVPQINYEQASGVFYPSGSFGTTTTYNAVVSKIGTGRYRVTFISSFTFDGNYVAVISESDNGTVYSWRDSSGALDVVQLWTTNQFNSRFDINIKQITSRRSYWPDDPTNYSQHFYSRYTDSPVRVSFACYGVVV